MLHFLTIFWTGMGRMHRNHLLALTNDFLTIDWAGEYPCPALVLKDFEALLA